MIVLVVVVLVVVVVVVEVVVVVGVVVVIVVVVVEVVVVVLVDVELDEHFFEAFGMETSKKSSFENSSNEVNWAVLMTLLHDSIGSSSTRSSSSSGSSSSGSSGNSVSTSSTSRCGAGRTLFEGFRVGNVQKSLRSKIARTRSIGQF